MNIHSCRNVIFTCGSGKGELDVFGLYIVYCKQLFMGEKDSTSIEGAQSMSVLCLE